MSINNIHTNADSKSAKENQVLIYICIHYWTDASRDKYISNNETKQKTNKSLVMVKKTYNLIKNDWKHWHLPGLYCVAYIFLTKWTDWKKKKRKSASLLSSFSDKASLYIQGHT